MPNRRQTLVGSLVATGGMMTGLTAAPSASHAQGKSSPQALAEQFAATLSGHDIAAFAALFDPGYVNHQMSAAAPAQTGHSAKDATVAFFAARLSGIPDLTVAIEIIVGETSLVAASFVYTGTHGGTYFGIAPTGRPLRFTSCDIFEVRDGRFVEHWGMGDIAGVLAQLRA